MDKFKIGDRVNVRNGGTVYIVTELGKRGHCMIREEGTAPNGKPYKAQPFDTSCLDFEDPYRNERVKRIKAGGKPRVTKAHADHIIGRLCGVQEGEDPVVAARKVIDMMKQVGQPAAAIRKAERMLEQVRLMQQGGGK